MYTSQDVHIRGFVFLFHSFRLRSVNRKILLHPGDDSALDRMRSFHSNRLRILFRLTGNETETGSGDFQKRSDLLFAS